MLCPILIHIIFAYGLNVNICGTINDSRTQWYILFVVIAVQAIDKDIFMLQSILDYGISLWKRLLFPSIAPHLVSGAMTASGGAWNASIAAEVLRWGERTEKAQGLGAYIFTQGANGDVGLQVLGILVMCLYVVVFNRLFWLPLYRFVEKRYST